MQKKYFVEDYIGKTIKKLTILKDLGTRGKKYQRFVLCDCICGNKGIERNFESISRGYTASCGCHRRDNTPRKVKHGMFGTKEYNTWTHINGRCYNKNNQDYANYGGRGVRVSDAWRHSFEEYFKDTGYAPSPKHTLDRKDVNGDYCKENCRWVLNKVQCNNKRNNFNVTHQGRTQTLQMWAEELGIGKTTLRNRLVSKNWTTEEALTIPVNKSNKNQNWK